MTFIHMISLYTDIISVLLIIQQHLMEQLLRHLAIFKKKIINFLSHI